MIHLSQLHTHKDRILYLMLTRGEISAPEVVPASNPNVEFCDLKKVGLCQDRWGYLGDAHVKFRSIPEDKIENVREYLTTKYPQIFNEIIPQSSNNHSATLKQLYGAENE